MSVSPTTSDSKKLKWLQWAPFDLTVGLGGVETHARCLGRELAQLGVEVHFSNKESDLYENHWDVIHTHGSGFLFSEPWKARKRNPKTLRIHTLHGLTHERMLAMREFLWIGGYVAIAREVVATVYCKILLSIHSKLSLFRFWKFMKKICGLCPNAWDSLDILPSELPQTIIEKISIDGPFITFIGRGADPVKGASRLALAMKNHPDLTLFAVPGSGFESEKNIFLCGPLSANQISLLLKKAMALILPSFYEGLPLVVLEALAQGTVVFATNVGGLRTLSPRLRGFEFISDMRELDLKLNQLMLHYKADKKSFEIERQQRAKHNLEFLPRWRDSAQMALNLVHAAQRLSN